MPELNSKFPHMTVIDPMFLTILSDSVSPAAY